MDDICRICLCNSKILYELFDSITPDIGSTSSCVFDVWRTFVKILKNTDKTLRLPARICENCRDEILGAYSFATKCENAKMIFRQLKQVEVRLRKLKLKSTKKELTKPYSYNYSKRHRVKKVYIPLNEVEWAYNGRKSSLNRSFFKNTKNNHNLFDNSYPRVNLERFGNEEIPVLEPMNVEEQKTANNGTCYKCATCNQTFALKISYYRHMKTHNDKKGTFECPICNDRFISQSVFEVHSFMHSVNKSRLPKKKKRQQIFSTTRCEVCNKQFSSVKSLLAHKQRHDKSYPCNICTKQFNSKIQLINHLVGHKGQSYVCEVCGKKYDEDLRLNEHMKSHDLAQEPNDNNDEANYSRQTYIFNQNMNRVDIFQIQNPYACDACAERFPTHIELIRHKQIHSNGYSHACELCGKQFSLAYALKLHMRVHNDERRQLDCGLCGETFEEESALNDHMRIHQSIMYLSSSESQFNEKVEHNEKQQQNEQKIKISIEN